jgi:hypothetical protein
LRRQARLSGTPTASWLALPLAVIIGFVTVTALVNCARWGNPLVFVDFNHALINDIYTDRLGWMQRGGEFSVARIGYGLAYYFAPVWALRDAAGSFLWPGFEDGSGACCIIELPPSSFFVSDALLMGLCAFGIVQALRKTDRRDLVIAGALGLLVPIGLILMAFSMTFRYRMEFYPFFELFAFLGFARLAARSTGPAPTLVAVGALSGIVTAHAMWVLYTLSPFGPAGDVLGPLGVGEFYRSYFP